MNKLTVTNSSRVDVIERTKRNEIRAIQKYRNQQLVEWTKFRSDLTKIKTVYTTGETIYFYQDGKTVKKSEEGDVVKNFRSDGSLSSKITERKRVHYRQDGTVKMTVYTNDRGDKHRLDGPAVVAINSNGQPRRIEYWINGYDLTQIVFKRFGDVPQTKEEMLEFKRLGVVLGLTA